MIDSTYRRALVTEARSGISKATVLALEKAHIALDIVRHFKDKLAAVADLARTFEVDARCYSIDLASVEQMKLAFMALLLIVAKGSKAGLISFSKAIAVEERAIACSA